MTFDDSVRYQDSHEWARQEGDVFVVGISDYAQDSLGDVVFVELPEKGKSLSKGDPLGVVESVKAASDIYAPISGEVTEVNEELGDKPELVNQAQNVFIGGKPVVVIGFHRPVPRRVFKAVSQTARVIVGLEKHHLMTGPGQIIGCGHTRKTRTNYGNFH